MTTRWLFFFLWLATCAGCGRDARAPLPKRIVDLSPVLTADAPTRYLGSRAVDFLAIPPRLEFTPIKPSRESYAYGLALLTMPSQIGAHVDPPGRLLKNGWAVSDIPLNRLVAPARIVDLRWKAQESFIEVSDLEQSAVEPGEAVLLYVGYAPPREPEWPRHPVLSIQAAQWLAARQVSMVLTDAPTIGSYRRYEDLMRRGASVEQVWAEKLELFRVGIPVVEGLANVGEIVGEKRVLLAALPLPLPERAGAPARVVALVY